jgi:hypothetical protein
MGPQEITKFLSHLASDKDVAASTQNQAFSALLFLYRDVLRLPFQPLEGVHRTKRPRSSQSYSPATGCERYSHS